MESPVLGSRAHIPDISSLSSVLLIFPFLHCIKVENVVADIEHCINLFDHSVSSLVAAHVEEEKSCSATNFE